MPTLFVDGKPYEVKAGNNVLHACLAVGLNVPHFCWHPALNSVGACRLCAVKLFRDEKDTRGKIAMACMTPVADGLRISIDDPEAAKFRATVIEWLMVNHPHDCPVCDEGGECHLQDMTVMTGHNHREFRFQKRTHRNQNLGPLINHEMNRCIACYRCVRFYRDYAGGRDLDVFGWHDNIYFGRDADGVLESEFSGNLVEICPTGVFDDKTFMRHYTRKWDLQTAPSVCVHCGLGCNTLPGERYGTLRRIRNRYHAEVNGYFLCDRGRFGYEFVNDSRRILKPIVRAVGVQTAVARAAALIGKTSKAIGIGSPRASLQANAALRMLVGPERFYMGVSENDARLLQRSLEILRRGRARSASLHDVESADAVLVLGEDVTQTAPLLALAIRQFAQRQPRKLAGKLKIQPWDDMAVRDFLQDRKGPLFLALPHATKLDPLAAKLHRAAPDDLARLGFAIAHALDSEAPVGVDLPLAGEIARTLQAAERPVIVSGTSLGSEALLQAAANIAWALCKHGRPAQLSLVLPECNSLGLTMLGARGGLESAAKSNAETVVVLENDLFRRAELATAEALLNIKHVIALDHLENATTNKAEVVFPAATFAESTGTLVNSEGRAQRFYKVFAPQGEIQESWRWLRDIMRTLGRGEASAWNEVDDVDAALAQALPEFKPITEIAPPAGFRLSDQKIPREPQRYSGRTAMHADVSVHGGPPPRDPDSPLAFSMEGRAAGSPPPLIPRYWAPGWNSVQALYWYQEEPGGKLRGGSSGKRLLEPPAQALDTYFDGLPAEFAPRLDHWLLIPLHHIFGSEELSALAPGIAELTPKPYLALSAEDAQRLGVREGQNVQAGNLRLPAKLLPSLPQGVAGVPAGVPGLPYFALPAWISPGGAE